VLNDKYLNLKMVRLNPKEEWDHGEAGITFVFPKSGIGEFSSTEVKMRVVAGDALILKRESGGKLCVSKGNELVFWHFSVVFENLFPLFSSSEIPLLQNVMETLKGPIFHSGAKSLAKDCHRLLAGVPAEFDLHHRTQLLRVVGTIMAEEFKRSRSERVGFVRSEDHLMQVFEKLPVDELLTLSVGELSDRFGCSRRHLSRLFHQHFGCSIAALRMEMRLLKAMTLLRDPDAKIINVAHESGFNHLGLFNECFKKRFGTTAGQWRKMSQQTPNAAGLAAENRSCPLRSNGLCAWPDVPETANSTTETAQVARGVPAQKAADLLAARGIAIAYRHQQLGPGDREKPRPQP
jgi:AraC-like DNA-binding protein